MSLSDKRNEPVNPIRFVKPGEEGYKAIRFLDESINSRYRYVIAKTTENGRYVRGNLLYYKLDGVEVYTDLNNLIFVDEANKSLIIRENASVISEIAPDDPSTKQYVVLYTDSSFDEEEGFSDAPLYWESYIGRENAYEAIKTNIYNIDVNHSLILVDNVPLKDSLTVREFIEYLVNADIVPDEIDFDELD